MSTRYLDTECPYCSADATVKEYSHRPGGPRFGWETLISLEEKDCDCDWERGDAEEALIESRTEDSN